MAALTTRQRNLAVLIAIGVLAVVAGYFGESAPRMPRAMDAVPDGAFLVVSVDVGKLRAAGVLEQLGLLNQRGLDDVTAACGFDPLDRAHELVIAAPEEGEPGEFGLAITVDLDRDQVLDCAKKVLSARGGNPTVHEEDGFSIVEDTSLGVARPRIAVRTGAPLFVGHGPWLRAMMRAYDRQAPRALATSAHVRLRKELDADKAAISATAILPSSLREKLRAEVEGGQKQGGPTFGAILQVSEAAVALRVAGDAGGVDGVRAIAQCETAQACETLKDFIVRKQTALSKDWGVKLIGMASLLDAMHIDLHGTELELALDAPAAEIARVANRAWTFTATSPRQIQDAGTAPLRRADETIPARDR